MKQAECPVSMADGELLLRWSVPSRVDRWTLLMRRARFWMIAAALVSLVPVFLCAGVSTMLPSGWGGLVFVVSAPTLIVVMCVATLLGVARTASPLRWWATTRRLVVQQGSTVQEFALTTFESLEVDGAYDATVTFAGQSHHLKNAVAIPSMWGAMLLGQALASVDVPAVDVERAEPTVSGMVAWHATGKRGNTTGQGVMVFFPDAVAWLPGTATDLGDRLSSAAAALAGRVVGLRVTTVRPDYPFDSLFYRLMRLKEPSRFRPALTDVIDAWGGFIRPGNEGVVVAQAAGGDGVTVTVGETVYSAVGVAHPEWPMVRQALGV